MDLMASFGGQGVLCVSPQGLAPLGDALALRVCGRALCQQRAGGVGVSSPTIFLPHPAACMRGSSALLIKPVGGIMEGGWEIEAAAPAECVRSPSLLDRVDSVTPGVCFSPVSASLFPFVTFVIEQRDNLALVLFSLGFVS